MSAPTLLMAPPLPLGAELPENVQLDRVKVPVLLMAPPSPLDATLSENVLSVAFRIPALSIAPPEEYFLSSCQLH